MISTVTFSEFCDRFRDMDRNHNFSYKGKQALYDYIEQYEEDTDTHIELDVIALCCEFSELGLDEINDSYSQDFTTIEEACNWLQNQTTVIEVDPNTLIVGEF